MFKEYMHLSRFGNVEVEGIEQGKVYIFPKIDGTNASVWYKGTHDGQCDSTLLLGAGSRTRELSLESDNAGFCHWVNTQCSYGAEEQHPLELFFIEHQHLRLYGEWLVPHTFKGYREEAWRQFYVFDVYNDQTESYLSYEEYQPLMEKFGITYIPPLAIAKNGAGVDFLPFLEKNLYLCPDDGKPGEGIVLKNYHYYNKWGRQVWAKIVRQEFKEEHYKAMGAPEILNSRLNEERLLDECGLPHLIDKTIAKMQNDGNGWTSKRIPELFDRVAYDVVNEEMWDAWKKIGWLSINGKTMKALIIARIKEQRKELFA